MREAWGGSPILDSEEAPHREPVAVVEDTQSPANEDGTPAPCGPDQGHSDWEGQDGEGLGDGSCFVHTLQLSFL